MDRLTYCCAAGKVEIASTFDVTNADYYSLPNLVATMRVSRWSLADEIFEWPLLKLNQVLRIKEEEA